MKLKLILLSFLISSCLATYAQSSHDLVLFEAKGPVKSITLTAPHDNFVLSPFEGIVYFRALTKDNIYEFDRDGNLQFWVTPEYNSAGYITGIKYSTANVDYTYSNGKISEMNCKLKNNTMEGQYTYSSNGYLYKCQQQIYGDNIFSVVGVYSNYVFDKHGNWIKRSLTISPLMADYGEAPSNTVIQSRTIEYY